MNKTQKDRRPAQNPARVVFLRLCHMCQSAPGLTQADAESSFFALVAVFTYGRERKRRQKKHIKMKKSAGFQHLKNVSHKSYFIVFTIIRCFFGLRRLCQSAPGLTQADAESSFFGLVAVFTYGRERKRRQKKHLKIMEKSTGFQHLKNVSHKSYFIVCTNTRCFFGLRRLCQP